MKILVALSRFPWPIEKGDKLRAYYQLKGLAERHEVHLVCLNDELVQPEDRKQLDFCASLTILDQGKLTRGMNLRRTLFNSFPFQVNYFRSRAMQRSWNPRFLIPPATKIKRNKTAD